MQRIKITTEKIDIFEDNMYKGSGKVDGKMKPVIREVVEELSPNASEEKREKWIKLINKTCLLFGANSVEINTFDKKDTCIR